MKGSVAKISLAGLVFTGLLCTSHNDPGERKGNYFTKEQVDSAYDATYQVNTTVTLEQTVDDDYYLQKSWFGSGTLMVDSKTGDNYIFTAEHVTPDPTYTDAKTQRTAKVIKERISVKGEEVYLSYEASVFKEDEENDLALLKIDGSPKDINDLPWKSFRGKIALDIDQGDYVIGAGFPKGKKELFNTQVTGIVYNKTYLDIYMISGNSGGGVYLINNKELQLCGVVAKTDNIPSLDKVRAFFKGTPLEDDYL